MENLPEATGTSLPTVVNETLPIEQVAERMDLIERVVEKFMKKDRDYAVIPGTKKPSLLKPGSEKLALAFQLSASFETIEQDVDHWREWKYEIVDRDNAEIHTKEAKGFFVYRVRCTLTNRGSGVVMGDCEGICSSAERGRETSPANTVLKMAQKRALVGATLIVTFSSDRFTQDMEDYKTGSGGGAAETGPRPTDGTARWPLGKHKNDQVKDIPTEYLEWAITKLDGNALFLATQELTRREQEGKPSDEQAERQGERDRQNTEDQKETTPQASGGSPSAETATLIQKLLAKSRIELEEMLIETWLRTFDEDEESSNAFKLDAIKTGLLADINPRGSGNNKGHLARTIVTLWKIKAPDENQ